jgi:hypothetical protein
MSQANESRETEGVAERAQRELTGRVGVRLARQDRSSNRKRSTSRWRLGKRRGVMSPGTDR